MKTGLLTGVVLCLVAGIWDVASREEPVKEPDPLPPLPLPLVPPDEAPTSGTFYTFQWADRFPPLPMNQFPELPLYSLGDGFYLVDDRTVDYPALEAERTRRAVQELAVSLGVTEAEAVEVMAANALTTQVSALTTNGLHLLPPAATNGGFRIEMGGGAPGALYDLFSTTNLSSSATTNSWWQWRGRVANASPRILPDTAPEMFYILGTTQDTDGGGLTDAYERLVTHTQTNNPADDGTRPLVGIDLANTVVREQGGTTTQFNVWRAGSTAQPLAVALQRTGTATPGKPRSGKTGACIEAAAGVRTGRLKKPACKPEEQISICELRPLSVTKLAISLDLRCLKHAGAGRAESVLEGHTSAWIGA